MCVSQDGRIGIERSAGTAEPLLKSEFKGMIKVGDLVRMKRTIIEHIDEDCRYGLVNKGQEVRVLRVLADRVEIDVKNATGYLVQISIEDVEKEAS